jgi:K+-sensing histidine kinase KdpD
MAKTRYDYATEILREVGHDMKSPLTAVIGSLEALTMMGSRLSDQQRELLCRTGLKEAWRLQHFVQNILTLNRLENFGAELQRGDNKLNDLLRPLADRLKQQHPHVALALEESDAVWNVDGKWFSEAIWQVLDNIGKHNNDNVAATIRIVDGRLVIADEGIGIPSSITATAFDRHIKGPVTQNQDASAGVGLTIAKYIVDAHGGAIALQNAAHGAQILISLKK